MNAMMKKAMMCLVLSAVFTAAQADPELYLFTLVKADGDIGSGPATIRMKVVISRDTDQGLVLNRPFPGQPDPFVWANPDGSLEIAPASDAYDLTLAEDGTASLDVGGDETNYVWKKVKFAAAKLVRPQQ